MIQSKAVREFWTVVQLVFWLYHSFEQKEILVKTTQIAATKWVRQNIPVSFYNYTNWVDIGETIVLDE